MWLYEDFSFLCEKDFIKPSTKVKYNSIMKQKEDEWGRKKMKQIRPDLKFDKQWTNLFGETICKELFINIYY